MVSDFFSSSFVVHSLTSIIRKVNVKNLTTGETFVDEADVVIGARGAFTRTLWPEIDGLWDFAGKIVHSGQWDET